MLGYFAMKQMRPASGVSADAAPALAVIPFMNVGGDSAKDYLADGISDELATAIGKIPGVRIASRSGAYRYRGRRDVDVRDVGTQLNVRYVVQGTVRPAGDQLRISAQVTDATTGVELWAQSFDRTTKDVFKTQDDITAAIARALGPNTASTAASGADARSGSGTRNAEAYDLYMRGEFALRQRQIGVATEMFRKAIASDPQFARAYAGLSQTLVLTPYFAPTSQAAVYDRVVEAANTALARDSTLAEAWMSLALANMHVWRWDKAQQFFNRAVAADPSDLQTHFQFGRFHLYRGNTKAALEEWARAKAIDPFSALASAWTAYALSIEGRGNEALAEAARALQYDSLTPVVRLNVLRVYLAAPEKRKDARAAADRLPDLAPWNGIRAQAYAQLGIADTTRAFIRRMEAQPPTLWMRNTGLAYGYLGLGDTARALSALERSADAGEIWPTFSPAQDPIFDSLRGSTRWTAILKRVGLVDPRAVTR
jgi:TolB-like protein/Tfp pilus assembly protein PilF